MKKELYLILLLFVLIPSGSVYAQDTIGGLAALLERQQTGLDLEDKDDEADEKDEKSTSIEMMVDFVVTNRFSVPKKHTSTKS